MAQTRWMLDLLIFMVPNHSEDQNQEQEHPYITNISQRTLDEDSKMLANRLDCFTRYITRYQKFLPFFTIHSEAIAVNQTT